MVNAVFRGLLRTPGISAMIGSRLITVYVTGRRSGRHYAVPVAYLRDGDDLWIGTSGTWRHNLRTGDEIMIRYRGRLRRMRVTPYRQESDVVARYATMAGTNRNFARINGIDVAGGSVDQDDLHRAWREGAWAIRLSPVEIPGPKRDTPPALRNM